MSWEIRPAKLLTAPSPPGYAHQAEVPPGRPPVRGVPSPGVDNPFYIPRVCRSVKHAEGYFFPETAHFFPIPRLFASRALPLWHFYLVTMVVR